MKIQVSLSASVPGGYMDVISIKKWITSLKVVPKKVRRSPAGGSATFVYEGVEYALEMSFPRRHKTMYSIGVATKWLDDNDIQGGDFEGTGISFSELTPTAAAKFIRYAARTKKAIEVLTPPEILIAKGTKEMKARGMTVKKIPAGRIRVLEGAQLVSVTAGSWTDKPSKVFAKFADLSKGVFFYGTKGWALLRKEVPTSTFRGGSVAPVVNAKGFARGAGDIFIL